MRFMLAVLVVTMVAVFTVGCCATTHDVTDVNETWKALFDSMRRPTAAEAAEYEALDDAGKEAWEADGKPTSKPIEQDELDVIAQMYEANKALGKAHEGGAEKTDEVADEPEVSDGE